MLPSVDYLFWVSSPLVLESRFVWQLQRHWISIQLLFSISYWVLVCLSSAVQWSSNLRILPDSSWFSDSLDAAVQWASNHHLRSACSCLCDARRAACLSAPSLSQLIFSFVSSFYFPPLELHGWYKKEKGNWMGDIVVMSQISICHTQQAEQTSECYRAV